MIGAYRHKVSHLAASRTGDGGGGGALDWTVVSQFWAQVLKLSSAQDFLGDRQRRLKRIAVTTRKRPGIVTGHRIGFDGEFYEITSIENDGDRGLRLVLICEEAVQ